MSGKKVFVVKNLTTIEVDDDYVKFRSLKEAVKNGAIRISGKHVKLYDQNGRLNKDRYITETLMQAIIYCLMEEED